MRARRKSAPNTAAIGFLLSCCLLAGAGSSSSGDVGQEGGFDPNQNQISQHDSSSDNYNKSCSDCHASIHTEVTLDPAILPAHRVMFPFAAGEPGSDKQCVWCHRTVDLTAGTQRTEKSSTGNLRRHVDVLTCTLCHGPFRGGPGRQFYEAGLSPADPDGPLLYGLLCEGCHGELADSEVQGEDAEEIQQKIDEDEGGMGALSVLTPGEIDAIAAAL